MSELLSEHTGQLIDGRYEIIESLGHGGMSDTYKARDTTNGQIVVVKIPHSSLIGDPATFSRYEREMKVGERLHHPHVQGLIAMGHPGGGVAPYMVLEYVEGTLLRNYLEEKGKLPIGEAIDLTGQLADALQYCHEQGVVHRDLKPENVLVTPDGQVKLVDFGIALLQGARRITFGQLTGTIGTPDYMAPEQVRGERGDARTDIYAVGVMLYEMLAGEVPYQGDNPLAIMSQHVTRDPPRLTRTRRDVSPQLETVVFKALRRDPNKRYQSMVELGHDLEFLDAVEPMTDEELQETVGESDLPTFKRVAMIVLAIFGALIGIAIVAQLAHRAASLS